MLFSCLALTAISGGWLRSPWCEHLLIDIQQSKSTVVSSIQGHCLHIDIRNYSPQSEFDIDIVPANTNLQNARDLSTSISNRTLLITSKVVYQRAVGPAVDDHRSNCLDPTLRRLLPGRPFVKWSEVADTPRLMRKRKDRESIILLIGT